MSVARFEFVIGPFLIIDLAKISAFPICVKCCCWPNQSSHPLCHRRISVQSQLPAITGGPDFGRGLFFVVLAPFHPVGRFLNFAVALEIDLIQVGVKVVDGISQQFRRQFHGRFVRGSLAAVTRGL